MPTIIEIDGVKIRIFSRDHNPPHFHLLAGNAKATVRISDLQVMNGGVPRRALERALEWAAENRETLMLHWNRLNGGRR